MGKKKKTSISLVLIATHATKPPTGLDISRAGGKFTCSWKIGDSDYEGGQWFRYRVNGGSWTSATKLDAKVTSRVIDLTSTIGSVKKIEFAVKGLRKDYSTGKKNNKTEYRCQSSDYVFKTWTAAIPDKPSLSFSRNSNTGTFTWGVGDVNDTNNKIFTSVELQTWVSYSNSSEPQNPSISSQGKSGSVSYTETLSGNNLVRWVRVRSRGPAGNSAWATVSHTYGNPAVPNLLAASSRAISSSVLQITAQWSSAPSLLYPIDTLTIQYAIAVPTTTNLSAPSSGWTDAITVNSNGGGDTVVATVSESIDTDECLWVRIKSNHDEFSKYSNARLAGTAALDTPGFNANPNFTTGDVTFTVTENTDCTVACTAIFYRPENNPSMDQIVAIFAHGTTTGTVNVPGIVGKSKSSFGAYAFVGTYTGTVIKTILMQSQAAMDEDIAAVAPAWVSLSAGSQDKSVRVNWAWSWAGAHSAEIGWADHDDAWESTDQPKTYLIEDKVTSWVVAGLEAGKRWYFRVRLKGLIDTDEVTGPWSVIYDYDLSSIPDRPGLILSKSVINSGQSVTARWAYSADDSTQQQYAEICLATITAGVVSYGAIIAKTTTAQTVEIVRDWTVDTTYYLCLRLTSTAGRVSEWSEPVALTVAPAISISISQNSNIQYASVTKLSSYDYDEDTQTWSMTSHAYDSVANLAEYHQLMASGENGVAVVTEGDPSDPECTHYETRQQWIYEPGKLVELPLGITVTGAGSTGTTIVSVIRAEDYHIYRPDDSEIDGYEGETIATLSQTGESAMSITTDNLVGCLDDGAKYIIRCTVIDKYGQTASLDYPFTVDWTHQPGIPSATVEIDEYQRIAIITPIAPDNYVAGDVCDIYRISTDKPELIVKGAAFGTAYVDPYPAFGDSSGHRIVTRTANGDYVTQSNELAWFLCDFGIGDVIEEDLMVIDVNGDQIELPYDITLQNSWSKDFKRTSYLGGSVQGDWNPAVTRDISANTVIVRGEDLDDQIEMRRLAGYAGAAHIRTPDGSSVACDIQVRESQSYDSQRVSYSLAIKVVDPQAPEGMTLAEWNSMNPVG